MIINIGFQLKFETKNLF